MRNIVYKVNDTTKVLTKLTNVTPIKENNGIDISYLLAPYGGDTVMMKLLPNKFFELTNVNPIPAFKCTRITDQEVIDAIVPEGDGETGWYLYYFPIGIGVSGILKSNRATQYQVSFQRLEVDLTDDDYIGNYATASTVDATISTELDVAYPSAVEGNYVNVYKTTSNLYTSWLLVSTTWVDQDSLTNETLIDNTLVYNETFKSTTVSNNEFNIGTPSEQALVFNQIYGELEDINVVLAAIVGDVAGLMTKAEFVALGLTGIVDKAAAIDDDAGNTATAAELRTALDWLNQALLTTSSPTFAKVTTPILDLGTVEITEETNEIIQAEFDSGNIIRLGEELDYQFKNDSGSIITKGTPVYISGADGTNVLIKPSINTNHDIAIRTVGITKADVAINGFVKVILFGNLRNVATDGSLASPIETWVAGDEIYLNGVLGSLTNVRPTGSDTIIFIGVVQRAHATLGELTLQLRHLPRITELSAIHPDWADLIDGDFLTYDVVNNYMIVKNLNDYAFVKTGWDLDIQALVSLSFVNATRTFTLAKTSAVVPYWQENIKYELDADKTVVIDDTEGLWFIYIVDGVLTASQTAWDLRADNAIPVSVVNWDATNNEAMAIAYECHSHLMSGVDHYDSHFGLGTLHIRGGALSDNGSDQLDLTALTLADEDINISVVDDDTPTAYFEQPLTPLKSYKYYRDGANGDLRRVDDSTTPFYMLSNKVQLNPFGGGTWGLTPMTNNKYGAYWNIWTTDISNPVKQFLGQEEADSLDDAIASNTLSSLDLGTIPFEEIKVAYRIIVKQIVGAPYYEITQIDNMLVDPITGVPTLAPTSHGALSGLGDDDHTQYSLWTDLALTTGAGLIGNVATGNIVGTNVQAAIDELDDEKVAKDLSNNTTYPIATAAGIADDLLTDVFIDDNGTPKKITLNEIYVGANAATGAFVPSGDYESDGLGAYETAVIDYHTLTLDTLGKYKVTIKTMETTKILYVKMPTISSNQNDLQISTDDGTTYYDVLVNGATIYAELVSEKLLKLQFDGSNFIIDLQSLSQQLTFDSAINSTYGTVAPINGSPHLNKFYGLSLNSIAYDQDVVDTGTINFDSVSGVDYYDWLNSVIIAGTGSNIVVTNNTGATADMMVVIISNTPIASKTAPQLANIIPTYFEGYTYIVNPELWSRGLNLFDKTDNITYDYYVNHSTGELTSSGASNTASDYIRIKSDTDYYVSGISNTNSDTLQYALYDSELNFISGASGATKTFNSGDGNYIRFTINVLDLDTTQLEEGTTATTYQAYNSPQDNFKLTANLLSVGSIRDEAYEDNGAWWKKAYVGVIEDVAISDVIDTTAIPLILETTGVFYAVDSVNNEAQYGTYGDTLTLTGTSTVYYQLATQTTTAIEKNGSLIQEANTTLVQLNNFATSYTLTFALDSTAQRELDTSKLIYLQGEVDDNETNITTLDTEQTAQGVRITDNESDIGTIADLDTSATDLVEAVNEVHGETNTNTTAIGLNTTHRSSNGTDHANVVTNTTNIGTIGDLDTTATNLVGAVNEVHGELLTIVTETSASINVIASWFISTSTIKIFRNVTSSTTTTGYNIISAMFDSASTNTALVYSTGSNATPVRITTNTETWTRVKYV